MPNRLRRIACSLLAAALLAGCAARSGQAPDTGAHPEPSPSADDLPELLPPPPPPRHKPALPEARAVDGRRQVPVVERVSTRDRVVFLTIDDGVAKDPAFARLTRSLKVPFSMFLTDSMAGDDYGYFDGLREWGNQVQNHTLTHPRLPDLSLAGQRREICGQQERLERVFGQRPTLFRPPRGHYDSTTLQAAADCGIRAAVMWRANMQPGTLQYDAPDRRLRPGDVILFHFFDRERLQGATLVEETVKLLRAITDQGYAVARLEDYL